MWEDQTSVGSAKSGQVELLYKEAGWAGHGEQAGIQCSSMALLQLLPQLTSWGTAVNWSLSSLHRSWLCVYLSIDPSQQWKRSCCRIRDPRLGFEMEAMGIQELHCGRTEGSAQRWGLPPAFLSASESCHLKARWRWHMPLRERWEDQELKLILN